MKQLYIQLTTLSPLAIRSDHAATGADAAGYIPGTAFIGSMAAVHRLLKPDAKKEFEQLFLSEQVLYPDLYPAFFKDEGRGLQTANIPVYPLPRTAQSCKRHSGFFYPHPPGPDNDNHGVRDSLVDWAVFRLRSDGKSGLDPLEELQKDKYKECQKCKAAMDHFSGYYRRSETKPEDMMTATTSDYMRLQTHTGIDRDSGTVQEGILYNRKVFEEGMRFWGAIKVPDDDELWEKLTKFLKQVGPYGLLRVGTGRTRGMGKVEVQTEYVKNKQDSFEKFCERLHGFHNLLAEPAKQLGLEDRYFFALTLHSPLILIDDFLRYLGTIESSMLEKLLGYDETIEMKQVYQSARMRRVTGWLEIWGAPRMNEYAIETGSVFLFSCNAAKGTPANETLLRRLFELEEQGIGKRGAEGFGRVRVSDQFHQEREVR